MTEPDVALTDFGLSVECLIFALVLGRAHAARPALRRFFVGFFFALAGASLTGGLVHGFFQNIPGTFGDVIWRTTLILIGVVALLSWSLGTYIWHGSRPKWFQILIGLDFLAYTLVILFFRQDFWIAIANYLPPTIFLFLVFFYMWIKKTELRYRHGLIGLTLTFIAAAVQQLHIGISPEYFNHNALYHLIQAIALAFLFQSAKQL